MKRDFKIALEKGNLLTEEKVVKVAALLKKYLALFTVYPDLFIDLITPKDSGFVLYFFQRIYLRACMRYSYVYITAGRGTSKTFLAVLATYLRCVFQPNTKQFICAPGKGQGMGIAAEKIEEIWRNFPLLEKEIIRRNISSTNVHLWFRNGSEFTIVAALDSQRGGRRNGGLIDEVRDHDQDMLNQVVLPLMTLDRRMKNGLINQDEPQHAQIYSTSAGSKSTYAYEKLIEILIKSVIAPQDNFLMGLDVRIPIMHGLVSKKHIDDQRTSGTFKEGDYAREYLSIWTGGSSESWFNYNRILKYRSIVNAEKKFAKNIVNRKDAFYLISVDVGRLSAQTVFCVFKVIPQPDFFLKKLVNIVVLEDKHFEEQSIELKRTMELYNVRHVIVDGTGIGVGLLDFLVKPNVDEKGNYYPPIGVINDDDYLNKQPRGCEKKIFIVKLNPKLNSEIHSVCFAELMSGKVRFLIREQEAKHKLLSTQKGSKMPPEQRIARLMPYEMTTRLFDEMCNLKAKPDYNGIMLERINSRMGKDKFSAFEYGVWRIKILEEEHFKSLRNHRKNPMSMVFYTPRR
jgi:hypothetical protein